MNTPTETVESALAQVLQLFAQQDMDQAWTALNQAVEAFPLDARVRFLLGSMLAGLQQYEKAVSQFELAVQLDPNFEIARFQLGSLRFTSGDVVGARQAWAPFAALPDLHPLKCFKNGCEALMEDRFEETVQWLRQGIALNQVNQPLNSDMRLLLDRTLEVMQNAVVAPVATGSQHLLMSGYQANALQDAALDAAVDPSKHTKH